MKLSTIALTLLIPISVGADEFTVTKTLPCDTASNMFKAVTQKYKETPLMLLDSANSKLILTANLESLAWTLIETDGANACALAAGQGFKTNDAVFLKHYNKNSV